jgi:DNA sulfur modification protein DndD
VQEIFRDISFTPYIPKISDKYELMLVENTAGLEMPVAASTGENQILSLSFISSIIDRVREWNEKKMLMIPDSSTFPIVMDSPFGSLDEIYRRQIAKTIPKLANQLVVLVTNTQWRGEVEVEMAGRVGREYVLTYYSSKPDCEEDSIDTGGFRYPLVKQSPNEFEYTEIIEVERHG